MSSENLLPLKDGMVAFIEGHGLHRLPGYVTDDIPSIVWEGQDNPDSWKDFVEMAKHVGAPFVTFSDMTLEREELDALIDEAGEMNFPDEEATELVEAKWLRKYAGMSATSARLRLSGPRLSPRNHHRVVRALPNTARRHRSLPGHRHRRLALTTTTRTSKPPVTAQPPRRGSQHPPLPLFAAAQLPPQRWTSLR